jgi:molybdenum cofactor guanylyltransferase
VQNVCAIVLAGGMSSRMGAPKASLEWHGTPLLRRVTGILARSVAGPIVVVRAPAQELPALPDAVEVVADERSGRGPLEGLVAGFAAVGERAGGVAYVSAVDVPLLHPAFVRAVVASVGPEVHVAVPEVEGRRHPLAAAYRVDAVRSAAEELLAEDRLALRGLLDRCRVRRLAGAELPALESLTNLNAPADYERALALPAPEIVVDGAVVRAWTLGELPGSRARAAVTLNGEPVAADPQLPLVAGDVVTV